MSVLGSLSIVLLVLAIIAVIVGLVGAILVFRTALWFINDLRRDMRED